MNNGESCLVPERSKLEQLLDDIQELPTEEKAQLVGKLLGQQAGVSVVLGNGSNHVLKADLVVQINNADKEMIQGITEAIARRIER